MGWNYLSISKLQRFQRWSLGIDMRFDPTLYNGCKYLSMLRLMVKHISKNGPRLAFESQPGYDLDCPFSHVGKSNLLVPAPVVKMA